MATATMRAVVLDGPDPASTLQIQELPVTPVFVPVSIGVTSLLSKFSTHAALPFALIATWVGEVPTEIVGAVVPHGISTGETASSPKSATYILGPASGPQEDVEPSAMFAGRVAIPVNKEAAASNAQ
jgi:hypothetical protein